MTDGLLVVDKPAGLTSHDVVARVRRLAGTRRVGHAGTLDPMATGVLVVGVGRATRLLHHLQGSDKAYTATIRLGQVSSTDDAEGELGPIRSAAALDARALTAATHTLTGAIQQVPSTVSAIKVDGVRAYRRARAGERVSLPPRPVTVSRFELLGLRRPAPALLDADVAVECSSGTYVRALARDLGELVGVGGHLTALRRTRVGPFTLSDAETLTHLTDRGDPVTLPLADAAGRLFPIRQIDADEARALSFGKGIRAAGIDGTYAAVHAGRVVALLQDRDGQARPTLVFEPAG